MLCWQIWDSRNKSIFRQTPPSPSKIFHVAEAIAKDYAAANPFKNSSRDQVEKCIKWKPPDNDYTKLNFDGSVVNNRSAAIGFAIRDKEGCAVLAGAKKISSYHVPISEALALREGLCIALRHKLIKIQVEGDSKLIIHCVLNKCSIPWRLKALIKDIQLLASQFQDI